MPNRHLGEHLMITPWQPTHKLLATFGQPRTVHCWLVMRAADGRVYTRHEWINDLPPALSPLSDEHWLYTNPETAKPTVIKATFKLLNADTPPAPMTFAGPLSTSRALRNVS